MLLELDKKVFGKITTKEIIGADPPATETKSLLEKELSDLLSNLESQNNESLNQLLNEQKASDAHVNSRPGAMALAQDKIQLFNEFSERYRTAIKEKLES